MKKLIIAAALTFGLAQVNAAEHTVKLVTSGTNSATMIMEPGYIKIEKGDVINFIPSDASHNAQSFSVPDGAKAFSTPFGKPTKVTFNTEGVYLYKCLPHTVMGMVGLVQVGSAINLEAAKKDWQTVKPTVALNKERMDNYLKKVN
ncbi:pseudoazurin [Pseudoalteromonas sp. C2R02]|uniref:pseudoazurin n=1 Tax=Pseudoalteromonas sp. C2R02 TaxID=2841565 RepID=UPI001C08A09E|nr:pseudoazurin [Pseudoalteromonas sp. C2R02]MBU2970332.1 pseudoazurin [Pseudoalteromonas sp. C2R02]